MIALLPGSSPARPLGVGRQTPTVWGPHTSHTCRNGTGGCHPRTTLPPGWQGHGGGLPASRPASWLASLRGATAGTPPLPKWLEASPPPPSSPVVLAARQGAGHGVASRGTLQGTSSEGSPHPTVDRPLHWAAPPTLQVVAPGPLNRGHPPPPHAFPSPGLVVHRAGVASRASSFSQGVLRQGASGRSRLLAPPAQDRAHSSSKGTTACRPHLVTKWLLAPPPQTSPPRGWRSHPGWSSYCCPWWCPARQQILRGRRASCRFPRGWPWAGPPPANPSRPATRRARPTGELPRKPGHMDPYTSVSGGWLDGPHVHPPYGPVGPVAHALWHHREGMPLDPPHVPRYGVSLSCPDGLEPGIPGILHDVPSATKTRAWSTDVNKSQSF